MLSYRESDDKNKVDKIRKALEKTGGHCPCRMKRTADTVCPCLEFRNGLMSGEVKEGETCHCGLFVACSKR